MDPPIFSEDDIARVFLRSFGRYMKGLSPNESLALIHAFIESLPAGILVKDEEGRYLFINRYGRELHSLGYRDCVGKTAADIFPGDPAVADIEEEDRRALAGERVEVTVDIPGPSGGTRHFRIKKFPLNLADGRHVLGYIMDDVTELWNEAAALSRAVDEKNLLLQEVYHRVKNNLATLSSLMNLEANSIEDPKARQILAECWARIDSIAMLNTQLNVSREPERIELGQYLKELATSLLDSMNHNDRLDARIETVDVSVPMTIAQPLGLIATELLTNTIKYAYPQGSGGPVRLILSQENGRLIMSVSDEGVGLPPGFDPAQAKSLGYQIVYHLCQQISARLSIEDRKHGSEILIELPV